MFNFVRSVFRVPHDFWSQPLLRNLKDKVVSSLKKQILMRPEKLTRWMTRTWTLQSLIQKISVQKGVSRIDPIWWYSLPTHGFFSEIRLRALPWSTYPGIKMCWNLCQLDLRVPYLFTYMISVANLLIHRLEWSMLALPSCQLKRRGALPQGRESPDERTATLPGSLTVRPWKVTGTQ